MTTSSFIFQLYFSRLRITFEASDSLVLPVFKGSAFRGCFGQALKREVCTFRKGLCESCKVKYDCSFSVLFNSFAVSDEDSSGRGLAKQPHPYLIVPFKDNRTDYYSGDRFGFEFTLIGSVVQYTGAVLTAVQAMGKIGFGKEHKKFTPVSIEVLNSNLKYEPLPYFGSLPVIRYDNLPIVSMTNNTLKLEFETPLRLSKDSKPDFNVPTFSHFAENLLNRLINVAILYCDAEESVLDAKKDWLSDTDKIKLTMTSKRLIQQTRFSGTQNTNMQFDGIIGCMQVKGEELKKWIPLLVTGSWLHAGSTTTFGLGKYSILFE